MIKLFVCDKCDKVESLEHVSVESDKLLCRECKLGIDLDLEQYDPEKHPVVENRGDMGFS